MAGSKMGSLKRKMGLKGTMKPGQMLSRMNEMKQKGLGDYIQSGERAVSQVVKGAATGARFVGSLGKAFIKNATGGDIRSILKSKKAVRGQKKYHGV